jgi:tetratricopeptide (TPR) repeat protein
MYKIEGQLTWTDAHLLAAATYLKRDNIEDYLKHINILLYQYPALKDFNTLVTYFYYKHKIDMSDYTSKRVGIIQLKRGQYDDAIKYLTEAYKSTPHDPVVLYNLSMAYSKKKDFKRALTIINECLIADSHYPGVKDLRHQILDHLDSVK